MEEKKYIGNKEKLRRANQKIVYLKRKLKKKEKIINAMAKFIEVFEFDEEIVKTYCDGNYEHCKHKEDAGTCISCIKQYFEKKVED